jgi:hypothetical protein
VKGSSRARRSIWAVAISAATALSASTFSGAEPRAAPTLRCDASDGPRLVNRLRRFLIHDGLVVDGGCTLVLVGEQTRPTLRGVVLQSRDGGRTVRVVAAFPRALHIVRIRRARGALWLVGGLRPGGGLLARARAPGGPWERVRVPSWILSLSAVAVGPADVWVAGSRLTREGTDAVVLRSRGAGRPFRVATRIRSSLARVAHVDEIEVAGRSVVGTGVDGVLGVTLASDDGGSHFYRVVQTPRLIRGSGVAAPAPDRLFASGSSGSPTDIGRMHGTLVYTLSGRRGWRTRTFPGTAFLGDVLFATRSVGYVATGTRQGMGISVTRDGGRSWRPIRFRGRGVTLEKLLPGPVLYAVGPTGLFRIGSPR